MMAGQEIVQKASYTNNMGGDAEKITDSTKMHINHNDCGPRSS